MREYPIAEVFDVVNALSLEAAKRKLSGMCTGDGLLRAAASLVVAGMSADALHWLTAATQAALGGPGPEVPK